MSMFDDIVDGLRDGFMDGLADRGLVNRPSKRGLETLLGELGWSVDERDDDMICLHFNGPDGVRKVYISDDSSALADFWVCSMWFVPMRNLPAEVPTYLLDRNHGLGMAGQWAMHVKNGMAGFELTCSKQRADLSAKILKWTCEAMVKEAADFDAKMRRL